MYCSLAINKADTILTEQEADLQRGRGRKSILRSAASLRGRGSFLYQGGKGAQSVDRK